MPDLEDIVQKIMLDGDTEILHKLSEIGSEGFETFNQLAEAAEQGASKLEIFGTSLGLVAAAVAGVTLALTHFVEVNDEAIQKTHFLADAFGATAGQLSGIEAAFAQAGVSTRQFENFAQRLVTTIAREWPQIAQAVRTGATEQEAANERVQASILRVQEAQINLANVDERTSGQITSAIIREEEAFRTLERSAAEAYATMIRNVNNVASANLSLEAAQQRLATLEGRPPSEADKQALALKEAQLAVDKARQASSDALRKQQQDAADASLKQAKLEQEAADAQLKRETLQQEAALARQKAELQLREAVTARAEAEERAAQQQLKNLPAIADALKAIESGNKSVAGSIDIAQVSIQNLVKSIILLSSEGGKLPPSGLKVMSELAKLLANDTGHLIDAQQRLAIVQALSQRGFNSTGQSAFELLKVLERGPKVFTDYENAASKAFANTKQGEHNVEEFKDALTKLGFAIDLVNRNFAAMASPVLTHFFEAIAESLEKDGGLLHAFVDGVAAIGKGIGLLIEGFQHLFEWIDKTFNLEKGRALQVTVVALVAAVGLLASAWLAIPAIIATIVTAIGYVAANWDKVKAAAEAAWKAVGEAIDTYAIKPIETFIEKLKSVWDWVVKIAGKIGSALGGGAGGEGGQASTGGGGDNTATEGFASGGHIRGPGTGTSDSFVIRASNGEFMMRSAAVEKFGVGFMHAINNLQLPGFAAGGPIGAPARMPVSSTSATRTLNLTIGEKTFSGLRGPAHVVNDLANYAVSRQTSSAGRQPSWVK